MNKTQVNHAQVKTESTCFNKQCSSKTSMTKVTKSSLTLLAAKSNDSLHEILLSLIHTYMMSSATSFCRWCSGCNGCSATFQS